MAKGKITLDVQAEAAGSGSLISQFLSAMTVLGLDKDPRCSMLQQCYSFYDGSQHDHHGTNWDGIPRDPGVGYMHERLKPQGFVPVNGVPHAQRRPDTPAPLGRQIVSRFTEMLLGEARSPDIQVPTDEGSQEYLEAVFDEASLWDVFAEARDIAGACGSAAIALGLTGGYVDAEVLHPAHVFVAEWDTDTPGWCPKVVIEQKKISKTVPVDPKERGQGVLPGAKAKDKGPKLESKEFWVTRAWTTEEVIYYEDVPVKKIPEDGFPIKERKKHNLGHCPVVWYQNTRNTQSPDGSPDCAGVWPLLDKIDRLQSQVYKAAIANTDPSLVIKQPMHARRNRLIQKGSNHVIGLPPEGDARYLEIQGTSVRVGLDSINDLASQILQTCECVVISPEYAKAYQSGEALQILWRSMESRASRLRVTLGRAIREVAFILLRMAEVHKVVDVEKVGTQEDQPGILLPPRRVEDEPKEPKEPKAKAKGEAPTPPKAEKPKVRWEPHKPGKATAYVALEWPPYWTPTAAQVSAMVTAMAAATTQKQILSNETATRVVSQMLGHDAEEEIRRLDDEKGAAMEQMMASMLGGMKDDDDDDGEGGKAPGGPPKPPFPPKGAKPQPEAKPQQDAKEGGEKANPGGAPKEG